MERLAADVCRIFCFSSVNLHYVGFGFAFCDDKYVNVNLQEMAKDSRGSIDPERNWPEFPLAREASHMFLMPKMFRRDFTDENGCIQKIFLNISGIFIVTKSKRTTSIIVFCVANIGIRAALLKPLAAQVKKT